MKAVIQRVRSASVEIDGAIFSSISQGLLVLLGIAKGDEPHDVSYIAKKIENLRIFADSTNKMNQSILEIGGAILVISQFTLLGDTRKGRRPGFDLAAPPKMAQALYESVIGQLRSQNLTVETGQFGSTMQVTLQNDGPVTFLLDSQCRQRTLL